VASFHPVNQNNPDASSLLGESRATSGASISKVDMVRSMDTFVDLASDHCRVVDPDGLICVAKEVYRCKGHDSLHSSLNRGLTGMYKERQTLNGRLLGCVPNIHLSTQ
jgi:hypothetical protein